MSYGLAILMLLLQGILPPILNTQPSSGFTVVHSVHASNCGNVSTCTTGSMTVTAGHALIAFLAGCRGTNCNSTLSSGNTVAASDSNGGNTWVEDTGTKVQQLVTGGFVSEWWHVCNAVGGSYTFTNTMAGTNPSQPTITVAEISGAATSSCVDTAVANTGNSASGANPSITSGTVGQASEFIAMGVYGKNTTITANQTAIDSVTNFSTNVLADEWTTGPSSGTQVMGFTMTAARWTGATLGVKHP